MNGSEEVAVFEVKTERVDDESKKLPQLLPQPVTPKRTFRPSILKRKKTSGSPSPAKSPKTEVIGRSIQARLSLALKISIHFFKTSYSGHPK